MLRKSAFFLFLSALSLLSACQSRQDEAGRVRHVVICWLKNNSETQKQDFLNAVYSLRRIPGVLSISAGGVMKSSEPVADNSFDLAFTIDFKSKSDLDSYIVHPHHKAVVNKYLKPALQKVVVYDYKNSEVKK